MFRPKLFVCLLALLVVSVAIPASGLVKEAPAPETEQTAVIKGQFLAANGEETSFRLPDRGAIAVRNEASGELILVSGAVLDDGRVELTFDHYAADGGDVPTASDRVIAEVGGEAVGNAVAPFQLAVQEIGTATRTVPAARLPTDPVPAESCCVTCGGWRVCCTVSGGWCCEISSSCGSGCSAGPCDAEIEPF